MVSTSVHVCFGSPPQTFYLLNLAWTEKLLIPLRQATQNL